MKPLSPIPTVVALAANDLPEAPSVDRARERTRGERRLRGPSWSSPSRESRSA